MPNKHSIYIFFLFFSLLFINHEGLAQKKISYKAEDQPLNIVLTEISSFSKVRFAFDDDYLSKINVSINFNNLSVEEFLKQLSTKYSIAYKLIGATWVVYKVEKKVVEKPKAKVEVIKPIPPPPIKRKIVYKKARLWDLTGTVIDVKSGNRLKFCQLFVDEYTNPYTNELGFFSDETVSTGDVHIKVNHFGFYPLDTTFILFDDNDIVIKLNPIWKVENSSVNSFSRIFQIDMPESTDLIALNPESGNYLPGINATDYVNSLKIIPGIYFSEGENAGFTTRGASPSENLILMDGIPVLNYSHLFGQLSTLNSKFIYQTFISRGGFGAEYGGGSSGVIELTGKSGYGNAVVDFNANMIDANLFVGIPVNKKISLSGSVRKSIVDYWPNYYYRNLVTSSLNVQTVGAEVKNGIVSDPFNNFFDINMKVAYRPNIQNEINFIFSNGYDNQKRSFSFLSDKKYFLNFQSDWRSYDFGLNWKFRSKNFWYNTFVASFNMLSQNNWFESGFKPEENEISGLLQSDQDINNSTSVFLKWKSEFSLKKFSHQFGAEYNFYHLNYNYHFYDDNSIEIVQMKGDSILNINDKHIVNLFYQSKYKLYKWIELTAGIRGLIDVSLTKVFIQPRAGIDVIPNNSLKLYYHFGRYIQPYYQSQRFGSDINPVPIWYLPTNSDQFIKSFHHIIGGNYKYEEFLVNIESYSIISSGKAAYFTNKNSGDYSNGELYQLFLGSGTRQGVDATIQFHRGIFNHSIAYSYSDCKEKFEGVNSSNLYPSLTYRHRLHLSETVAFSGWIASASFNYISGVPYMLQNSSFEQFNFSRLPDFSQLDISLVKQFTINSIKVEAGAVLLNLLGNKNVKGIEFFQQGRSTSNFIVQSTSFVIPFTPTFFITLKFD